MGTSHLLFEAGCVWGLELVGHWSILCASRWWILAIPWLVARKHRNRLSHSRFSAKTGGHHCAIISNLDSTLQLGLGLRTFSAIDAQLGNEVKGNHNVGASDEFILSLLSLQAMKAGMSLEAKSLIFI